MSLVIQRLSSALCGVLNPVYTNAKRIRMALCAQLLKPKIGFGELGVRGFESRLILHELFVGEVKICRVINCVNLSFHLNNLRDDWGEADKSAIEAV